MKATTIFEIKVVGTFVNCVYEGYFLQLPNQDELAEDIESQAVLADKRAEDDEDGEGDYHTDTAADLRRLLEVVKHSPTLIAPLSGPVQVKVLIAGSDIGQITVESLHARTRDADRALQELCA